MRLSVLAGVLVLAGWFGAMLGQDWMILLAGLGVIGPVALRESGLVPWRDDFQRETVMRSGLHALLVSIGLLVLVMATEGTGGSTRDGAIHSVDDIAASTVFLLLTVTWGISWLLCFWGPRDGARRILLIAVTMMTALIAAFCVYYFFNDRQILADSDPPAFVFLGLAWAAFAVSRRWPKLAGVILLAALGVLVSPFVGAPAAFPVEAWTPLALILVVPYLIPALALLTYRRDPEEDPA